MLGYFLDNEGFISYVDYVDEDTVGNYTTQPIPDGLNKPKWNGSAWVESMSDNELQEIHDGNNLPSDSEIAQSALLSQIALMETKITENQNNNVNNNSTLLAMIANLQSQINELKGGAQ